MVFSMFWYAKDLRLQAMLDLVQIILPRGFLSHLCEALLRDPDEIEARPWSHPGWGTLA
jgi:hypothetical protein